MVFCFSLLGSSLSLHLDEVQNFGIHNLFYRLSLSRYWPQLPLITLDQGVTLPTQSNLLPQGKQVLTDSCGFATRLDARLGRKNVAEFC